MITAEARLGTRLRSAKLALIASPACAAVAAFAAFGASAKDDAEAALKARLPGIFAKAAAHYRALDAAAAVMASALLELSGFAGGEKGAKYRAFAVKQLTTLSSPEYFSEGGEIGHFLLKHGVEHKPAGLKIDTPLDYGDYYFLEALLKLSK